MFLRTQGLVCVIIAVSAFSALGQDAYKAISKDAAAVIRIKNPKATVEKVIEVAAAVNPSYGDLVRLQSKGLGQLISNQRQAGVDKTGDWWISVYMDENDQPGIVYIIPATDVKAMKEAVGSDLHFAESGKYGVYSDNKEAFDAAKEAIDGDEKSISTLIEKQSQSLFDKGDISVFVNVAYLVTEYKEELEEAQEKALEQVSDLPANPQVDAEQMQKIVKTVFEKGFQAVKDTQSFTIATMISPKGVVIEELARFTNGSSVDKFLQTSPPSDLAVLNSLPAKQLGYMGIAADFKSLMGLSELLMGANESITAEQKAALAEIMKASAEANMKSMGASFSLGKISDGILRAVSITEAEKPAALKAAMAKSAKMSTIKTQGIKQSIELKSDAEKIGDQSIDIVTTEIEVDEDDEAQGEMVKNLITSLFGEEGIAQRVAYLKNRVVTTIGGGKESMETALDAQKSSADGSGSMAATRKLLSPKANLVYMLDLPTIAVTAVTIVSDSGLLPIQIDTEAFENLKLPASYIGFSAATEPQGLRLHTAIPVEQMQGISRLATVVLAMQRGLTE